MLTTLRIKNLALVAELTLELDAGYNVITGETGAGKSILIGALGLVLGQRADRTLIRAGADQCSVEAIFEVSELKAPLQGFLEENGLDACEEGQLLLKRTLSNSGTNRQFINGSPATLNLLQTIGEWLVDIHGPHEHQSLLYAARQLAIVDAYGGLDGKRADFAELLRQRARLESEKAALVVDDKVYAQQLDLLRFQVQEITSAQLKPQEEEQLGDVYRRASNAAKILQLSQAARDAVSENESSMLTQAGRVGRSLQEISRVDPSSGRLAALHQQAVATIQELQQALSDYAEKVEIDPARLQTLEERLNLIQGLKRKYGGSVAEILNFGEQAARKLQAFEQKDEELERINRETQRLSADLWRQGRELSDARRKCLPELARAVSKELAGLGFKQSRFEIALSTVEAPTGEQGVLSQRDNWLPRETSERLTASGLDTIEFQFAPNAGEPPRPLRAIASSGELARVMLALKTVLAAEDQIPTLVFDEVDANIGGETANAVGARMRRLATKRQVLCITHLPQVAAAAASHYVATKHAKLGRTLSEIILLDDEQRVTELARMLGGQTQAARQHAQALLTEGLSRR